MFERRLTFDNNIQCHTAVPLRVGGFTNILSGIKTSNAWKSIGYGVEDQGILYNIAGKTPDVLEHGRTQPNHSGVWITAGIARYHWRTELSDVNFRAIRWAGDDWCS